MKEPGYVYISTNSCFLKDWVKTGKSLRPVDVRSKKLDMCDIKNGILRELIKGRSTFFITGSFWMRLGKKKKCFD